MNVGASPSKLAPERADALKKICDQHNLELVIDDKPKFSICVSLDTHEITVPVAAMEYMWAQCLRFWVVSQEYARAQHAGAEKFDLHGNKRLQDVVQLVEWSGGNIRGTGKEVWPDNLPRPRNDPCDEDLKVANELFLGAMGWVILHEVAHVHLNHAESAGTYSQQQEKEADQFATNWVLESVSQADPRFNKRMFCIAAALLCLQSFETVAAPRWRGSHPPANERIYYCLEKYRCAETERVVAFLVVCLQVLFAETDVSPDIDGPSFDSILDRLFVDITRRNA